MQKQIIEDLKRVLTKMDKAGFSLAAIQVSSALDIMVADLEQRADTITFSKRLGLSGSGLS